jgi:hypothetical protein
MHATAGLQPATLANPVHDRGFQIELTHHFQVSAMSWSRTGGVQIAAYVIHYRRDVVLALHAFARSIFWAYVRGLWVNHLSFMGPRACRKRGCNMSYVRSATARPAVRHSREALAARLTSRDRVALLRGRAGVVTARI